MKNEYLNYFISLEKAKKMIIDEAIASLQHPSSKLWLDAGKNADLKIQNIITNWQKDPNNHNLAGYYSDTPEGPDQLGFNEWVESLSDVISNPLLSTPIGICIDGDWGIGKSFFIKMLFNNLSNDHFNSSGWMNIWIDSSLILSSKDTLNYISNTIYNNALSLSLKILGQDPNDQTASINWPGYLFSTKENEEPSDRIEKYLKNNVEKWSQDWQNKITNNFDWHILDLKKLIREIRYGILGVSGLSKIVIFIDDLDRCEEEVIWEIFSIHRSLLQEWGVIFIYAMDKRRVAEAIGNKLTYSRKLPNFSQYPLIDLAPIIKGELFLEKFFTHKIRPPQPSSKKLIKWFKSLIGNEFIPQNIGDGLEVGLSGNPRLIKQIANICGCIYNHLDSVDNSTISDSPWVRLISSINRNEIKQLICKTVVFAYGWPHIYEPIRMKPNRIKSVESCALTNSPISGYLQGKIISFPLDIGLQKLLIGNPKYPDKISHCYDIINIIDPYLTQAIHTERILQIIGYYDTKNVKTKTESSEIKHEIIASQQDINKTEEIISNWRENSDISLNILSILDYSLTINVADFFRNKNFNPIPEDLLNFAEKIHDSDLNSAKYLLIACLIHPLVNKELTLKCMETLAIIKENSLALEIFEYIQKKYLDDPKITPAYVGSLINMANSIDNLNDKKELINKAFILTYSYFNLNDNNIDKAVIDPTEEINQYWFSILFDVKTDNDEKNKILKIAKCAARHKNGKISFIFRNISRLLFILEQYTESIDLALAAVFLDENDYRAARYLEISLHKLKNFATKKELIFSSAILTLYRNRYDAELADETSQTVAEIKGDTEALWFFEYTVCLEPEKESSRKNLSICYKRNNNLALSIKALDKNYIPQIDVKRLDDLHKNALKSLLDFACTKNKITYCNKTIFNKLQIPKWINKYITNYSPTL